mgnify:CR=1 FL=1
MDITPEQVRAHRLRAHHLDRRYPASRILEAAGACGLQNSPPGGWETALFQRLEGCSLPLLRDALYRDRALLQAWSIRGVPLVFPAGESGVFLSPLLAREGECPWIYTRGITAALDFVGMSFDEAHTRVREAARFVGLRDDQLEKSPFELSGGQKRRVAIAGVIAMEPKVLILDEPTAGLDPVGVESILGNIRDYHQSNNATIILVSHSMEEVARTVDRLVVVNDGRIPFQGTPREVFRHGEELEAMGMGVPQMTRVFSRLRAMGVDIDASVYTIPQAKETILRRLREKGVE